MSETTKVYCIVLGLVTLSIFVIHILSRLWEYMVDKLFDDHKFFAELEQTDIDDGYSTDTVECLTGEYIQDWMHDPSSDVKRGDSVFVYLIQDKEYLDLLDTGKPGLFHIAKSKKNTLVVNLAVRNHISFEFERIHSITCNSLSPELASLEHQGMWFSYDMRLVG